MADTSKPNSDTSDTALYQIRVKGLLSQNWENWFDGMIITSSAENETVLTTGIVIDQAALYGLLRKVRDTGLELLSVKRIEPDDTESPLSDNE